MTFEAAIEYNLNALEVLYPELGVEIYQQGENFFVSLRVDSQITTDNKEALEAAIHKALETVKEVGLRIDAQDGV